MIGRRATDVKSGPTKGVSMMRLISKRSGIYSAPDSLASDSPEVMSRVEVSSLGCFSSISRSCSISNVRIANGLEAPKSWVLTKFFRRM